MRDTLLRDEGLKDSGYRQCPAAAAARGIDTTLRNSIDSGARRERWW
jgi:hypothetical protein